MRCYQQRKIRRDMGPMNGKTFHQISFDGPCKNCFYFVKNYLEIKDREKTNITEHVVRMCQVCERELKYKTAGSDIQAFCGHSCHHVHTPDTVSTTFHYCCPSHLHSGPSAP